jgi:hypothetical protein
MSSLGELFRDKRTMVKRPAKAHLFFLNVGRPSTEFQTFEHIPLALIHVEPISPVGDGRGRRSHCGHRKQVVFMTFLLATSRVAGFFGVLAIIVLSLSIGLTLPCPV